MRNSYFTFFFRITGSELEFEVGWFWVAVVVALIWWGL